MGILKYWLMCGGCAGLSGCRAIFFRSIFPLQNLIIMITTTTNSIEGRPIQQYIGIVSAETIIGANIFKDLFAGIRDIVGGRSGTYERVIQEAKATAMNELMGKAQAMGANAVVGVDLDFETIGSGGSMLMVVATGTAVRI